MPELPEVETSRRGIRRFVVGHTVKNVTIRQPKLRFPVPTDLATTLANHTFTSLKRRGKYLLFNAEHGTLILHLGMSGHVKITSLDTPPRKHDHVDILFDQHCLRYHDPRRFGCLLWTDQCPEQHRLLQHLGPEPLTRHFNGALLHHLSQRRQCTVKQFIMNHRIVVGVGNIYACESLFMAGIHPLRPAHGVSLSEYEALSLAIKSVLKKAIQAGGTTLKDFRNANDKPGYFKQALHVYGLHGHDCPQCHNPILKTTVGQRSTFYCDHCQH